MLIGQFDYNIDIKGRAFIPAKFREDLGERFIITQGLDDCIFVYSESEWKILAANISALPMSKSRNLQRFFFSGAADVDVDKQGRILIPIHLREFAHLDKDIMIIGASNRAEIWDKQRWIASRDGLTSDLIASAMDDLGF